MNDIEKTQLKAVLTAASHNLGVVMDQINSLKAITELPAEIIVNLGDAQYQMDQELKGLE